ncbi:MAG TPA: TonB-dependent receptor [Longimicrobium sp.]
MSLLLAMAGHAQEVRIHVADRAGGRAVEGAVVHVAGLYAFTDSLGFASVAPVSPGERVVRVSRIGYRTAELRLPVDTAGASARVRLVPAPIALAGIVVQRPIGERRGLRITGFYERRSRGLGAFLTRGELDRVPGRRLTDVLRTTTGVRIVPGNRGEMRVVSSRAIMAPGGGAQCYMTIYLDHSVLDRNGGGLDLIGSDEVEAIEVYRGPSELAVEYRHEGSACGVVQVWTRMGN